MTIIQAEKKIRNAWSVGLVLVGLELAAALGAALKGGAFNLRGPIYSLWDLLIGVLFLLFTFGIYLKNRMAAIGMFVYFLASTVRAIYSLISDPVTWTAFSQVKSSTLIIMPIAMIILGVLLYFSFEGARGVIIYHRLQQNHSAVKRPATLPKNGKN